MGPTLWLKLVVTFTTMQRILALAVVASVLLATTPFVVAAEAEAGADAGSGNELEDEMAKLGLGGGGSLEDTVSAAVDNAMKNMEHGAGGAQGSIPVPDPPAASMWSNDDWDDDDEEIDYLAIRKQKEFYPKKGDAQRLTVETFDEEVFNGEQEFTLVNFYSKWCKKCALQAASYRAAAKRYRDDPTVKVFVVNQEGNYDLSARFDTDPAEPSIFYAHKNPQIDGDMKPYEGEVSFAGLLQFIGSRGKEMIEIEKFERPLYPEDETQVNTKVDWDNFNQTVFDKTKNVMIQFYAAWSEFCQVDSGNYTVLAHRMKLSNPNDAIVMAINVDKHEKLADRFDVQGLPAYWFANKTATKDTDLVKYTGDHNGAMVIEELIPFMNSGGMKIPPGMQGEWPQHPKPWEEIQKDMRERDQKQAEKDKKEKAEQEKDATERREKFAEKKKKLQDKKQKKEGEKKDEL